MRFTRLAVIALSIAAASVVHAQPATTAPATRPATRPLTPAQQEIARQVAAQDPAKPFVKTDADGNPQKRFMEMHERFLARRAEPMDVLFLGDSITEGWASNGKAVFAERYAHRNVANFGISGDRTQHVLWRIANGELDGIKPKVVVLMIGTNNAPTANVSAADIVRADTAIVDAIKAKLPETKILLLGIFPRAEKPDHPLRALLKEINAGLARLDDGGKTVRFLDIGDKFLEADGTMSREVMRDFLHPSPKGYQIWAYAMDPTLDEMMK